MKYLPCWYQNSGVIPGKMTIYAFIGFQYHLTSHWWKEFAFCIGKFGTFKFGIFLTAKQKSKFSLHKNYPIYSILIYLSWELPRYNSDILEWVVFCFLFGCGAPGRLWEGGRRESMYLMRPSLSRHSHDSLWYPCRLPRVWHADLEGLPLLAYRYRPYLPSLH